MKSIRSFLLSRLLGGAALALAGAGLVVYIVVTRSLEAQFDRNLTDRVQGFASILFQVEDRVEFEFSDELMPEYEREERPAYFQVWFEDGELLEGREAIQADMESDWSESPDFTIAWSTSSVEMAGSGDLAVERGAFEYDPDGAGEAEEVNGQYVTIWKKMDGQWQVIMDVGGVLSPEAEEEEAAEE